MATKVRQPSRIEQPYGFRAPALGGPEPRRSRIGILRRAIANSRRDHVTTAAAALAYYAFLAIPSALMVAVGVFSLVGDPESVSTIVGKLGGIVPSEAQTLVRTSLTRVTREHETGAVVLAIGGALALWSLTGAMQSVMWALNAVHRRDETRGFLHRRLTALTMVGFAALGVVVSFGTLVLAPHLTRWVGDAVGDRTLIAWVWWIGEWPVLVCGLLVAVAGLYALGPNVRPRRWQLVSLGAVFAIVCWLVLSGAFSFYVSRFGSYNKTWGSVSAVVVVLTWLWLGAVALLVGAEIDAESDRDR